SVFGEYGRNPECSHAELERAFFQVERLLVHQGSLSNSARFGIWDLGLGIYFFVVVAKRFSPQAYVEHCPLNSQQSLWWGVLQRRQFTRTSGSISEPQIWQVGAPAAGSVKDSSRISIPLARCQKSSIRSWRRQERSAKTARSSGSESTDSLRTMRRDEFRETRIRSLPRRLRRSSSAWRAAPSRYSRANFWSFALTTYRRSNSSSPIRMSLAVETPSSGRRCGNTSRR